MYGLVSAEWVSVGGTEEVIRSLFPIFTMDGRGRDDNLNTNPLKHRRRRFVGFDDGSLHVNSFLDELRHVVLNVVHEIDLRQQTTGNPYATQLRQCNVS